MKVGLLNADHAGHSALLQPDVQRELIQAMGPAICDDKGEISRKRLAGLVFGEDASAKQNRAALERIVHPVIRAELWRLLRQHRQLQDVDVILLDAALLLESGWKPDCDAVVFIDTPLERRRQWTTDSRQWSAEELARREASQWPLDKKRSASDFVVDNSGDLSASVDQLESIVRGVIARTNQSR